MGLCTGPTGGLSIWQ